jgi:uncharacterized protein YeaO (DUF488 family)
MLASGIGKSDVSAAPMTNYCAFAPAPSIGALDDVRRSLSLVNHPARSNLTTRQTIAEVASMIRIKRAYEPATRGDGLRFLVERLWPRGLRKDALKLEAWLKDVAPSATLRKWFDHRVERWAEFQRRYRRELNGHRVAWSPVLEASRHGTVTLVYSAHDREHNAAVVLRDYLVKRARAPAARRSPAARIRVR